MEKLNVTRETIIRTVICGLALVNSILVMIGKPVINVGDDTIEQGMNIFITMFTTVWAWWKNNSFTQSALKGDEVMKELKSKGV